MASPVLSTYRLQMRGDGCTFDDAVNLLDYLDRLGVSHLYLSPILTAAEGSTHGYDVTDPSTVSSALGGPDGLRRLSEAARARNIGLIVDIVPNHVGVAHPEQNRWWWDLLTHGRGSVYADYFDIDWELDDGPDCLAGPGFRRAMSPIWLSTANCCDWVTWFSRSHRAPAPAAVSRCTTVSTTD